MSSSKSVINGLDLQPALPPLDCQARADWVEFRAGGTRRSAGVAIEPLGPGQLGPPRRQLIDSKGLAYADGGKRGADRQDRKPKPA
eukprot:895969-Alexandrium_andersonii.AAC.1